MASADELPPGHQVVRTTPVFDETTVPPALLAAHRIAAGVWGRLTVHSGDLTFCYEDELRGRRTLGPGDVAVIPPEVPHHIEIDETTSFSIEFLRVVD